MSLLVETGYIYFFNLQAVKINGEILVPVNLYWLYVPNVGNTTTDL